MNENPWVPVGHMLPPQNSVVETKIDDKGGVRNEQSLKLVGRMWCQPDGIMYVYYRPTHWRVPMPKE